MKNNSISIKPISKYDIAAKLTIAKKDYWTGIMLAAEQRMIFGGYYFGRKRITTNCNNQGTITVNWKTCWGCDWERQTKTFQEIADYHNPPTQRAFCFIG